MHSVTNRPTILMRLALLVAIVMLALVPAACSGGDDTGTSATTSTTAVADTGSPTTSTTHTYGGGEPSGGFVTTTASSAVSTSASTTTASSGAATTATTAKATTTTAKATTTTAKATTTTAAPTTTTAAKGPIVLTVSGPSGTKQFTMADLKAMPAVSGYGGIKNSVGTITAPSAYKGVSLLALVQLVGGSGGVTVVASDGYSIGLSAGEVSGSVATYDPATGETVTGIAVKTILAYSKDGGALVGEEGPLRIAYVSSEKNQVTGGDRWARMVTELRVK